jgi:ketosteroid isomerase-like protein
MVRNGLLLVTNDKDRKPLTDKGKYTTVFRKQADGSWKGVSDTVNSDLPLPGEAPTR